MRGWNFILGLATSKATSEPAEDSQRRGLGFWSDEEGQTLVEYGLLIGLLALVIVAAVTMFGRRMSNSLYGTANNKLPFE